MRIVAALCLTLLMLAGCNEPPDRHFTVAEDAPSSVDAVAGEGYTLRVQVVDLNTTPLAQAAVVLFHAGAPAVSFDGSAGPEGAQGTSDWRLGGDEVVAGLRTDAQGWVAAEVEPGRAIDVAVGLAGFTTELRLGVAIGTAGQSGTITVPLYPAQRTATFEAVAQNMVGTDGLAGPAYEAFPIVFDAEHDAGYQSRLDAVRITMEWTNLPTQAADLYVGLAAGDQRPFVAGADVQQVGVGAQSESLDASSDDVRPYQGQLAQRGARVAAMTDRAGLGIDGVPLTFTVEAQFRGSNVIIS